MTVDQICEYVQGCDLVEFDAIENWFYANSDRFNAVDTQRIVVAFKQRRAKLDPYAFNDAFNVKRFIV